MRELFLGEYIKQERQKQGISQEQLCEGICERITVSRMENGKQTPSYNHTRAFLQRLGLPDNQFFALLNKNELEIKSLQDGIHDDSIRFERAPAENRPQIRAAGMQKLENLEQIADPDDRIMRQYMIGARVTFGKPDGPYSPEERMELLLEALRVTVPNFDLEGISQGLYSMEETKLLDQIALTYAQMGQQEKSIDIYRQLFQYVQTRYSDRMSQYAGKFTLVAGNYAHALCMAGRYDDALEVAELGRKHCVEYPHYVFLPAIIHTMGECYFYQGDLANCKKYYRSAYCLYKVTGDDHNRLLLEKAAKERLGLEFPF